MRKKVVYIISDIDKSLAFEWIAALLSKERFDLSFILLNNGRSALEDFLEQNNVPVTRISCPGKLSWPGTVFTLYKYLRNSRTDIVHCHLFTANILGLTAAKLAGIPVRLYTRHHSDFHFRYFPKGVKWDKYCNYLATKIIAPSTVVRNVLVQRENVAASKIATVYHGFDISYFQNPDPEKVAALQAKYNPDNQHPVIGVIARFTRLKGIQYIIPAFKKLLQLYPDARLLLFNAQGDYKDAIQHMLNELPRHSYQTVLFEPDLASLYPVFDIFIQASIDKEIEAFGQTYIEALAVGIPSVFTMAGIANDFIKNRENAIVVPFEDEDTIYKGMLELLQNRDLMQHIIKNGKNAVQEHFSINTMIHHLENLYMTESNEK